MNKVDLEELHSDQSEKLKALLSRLYVITTNALYINSEFGKEYAEYVNNLRSESIALFEECYKSFSEEDSKETKDLALELFALKCNIEWTKEIESKKHNNSDAREIQRILGECERAIYNLLPKYLYSSDSFSNAINKSIMRFSYYLDRIKI